MPSLSAGRAACGASFASAPRSIGETHEALSGLLAIADFTTPSRFLETILSGPIEGRRKLYGRLGMASRDAIDELMNSALEFERNETASLDRFLSWFSRGTVDVQRDPGQPANEVRVMTVHGAKGLEAPVVILADATADPARLGRTPLTLDFEVEGAGVAPLLRPKKDERRPPFDEIILAAGAARPRGAYAAALRRADPRGGPADRQRGSAQGEEGRVGPATAQQLAPGRSSRRWCRLSAEPVGDSGFATARPEALKPRKAKARTEAPARVAVPDWARRPAPPEARPPRPLAPSAIAVDDEAASPPSEAMRAAARRGTLIHALLERLAAGRAAARADGGAALARAVGRALPMPALRDEIVDQVCGILSDPRFAPLFGPGSLGEAPLAATLPDGRVIAGTVDRLLVERDRGFRSSISRRAGCRRTRAAIPAPHRAQMQAYCEALRVIFPGREVRGDPALHRRAGSPSNSMLEWRPGSAHMSVNF